MLIDLKLYKLININIYSCVTNLSYRHILKGIVKMIHILLMHFFYIQDGEAACTTAFFSVTKIKKPRNQGHFCFRIFLIIFSSSLNSFILRLIEMETMEPFFSLGIASVNGLDLPAGKLVQLVKLLRSFGFKQLHTHRNKNHSS
jgi:hypothetical protein